MPRGIYPRTEKHNNAIKSALINRTLSITHKLAISKSCSNLIRSIEHCENIRRSKKKLPGTTTRDSQFIKNYGITELKYNEMLKEQDNVCKICKKPEVSRIKGILKRLAVDHDHKTGKVRGLLCNNCNRALGLLKDDITVIIDSLEYLKKSENIEYII